MEGDRELIQIVDAALAEAVRKSGPWLACRPGCSECCLGPFAITQLDAARLRRGLTELSAADPARAGRVRQRAREAVTRMPQVPRQMLEGEDLQALLDAVPDDEPCPALDLQTGTCDLYAARPVTCRLFGPPILWGPGAAGVCQLCFQGATDEEIAACEVPADIAAREEELLRQCEPGETLVALALV